MADLDISQSHINTGTAAVSGVTVTGVGTTWAGIVRKGDLYGTHLGSGVRIASVDSNTSLTLAYAVAGLAQANGPYEIQRTPYDIGYLQAIEDMIRKFGIGNLPSLAALDGSGGDKGVMLGGAGLAATFALTAAARQLLDDPTLGAMLTTLGAQAADADLAAIAMLTTTEFGREFLTLANQAGALSKIGAQPVGNYQPGLGFAPVQQGTGIGQTVNDLVKIGWSAVGRLKATVNNSDRGSIWTDADNLMPLNSPTGYTRMPSGLIVQWGRSTQPIAEYQITFPTAFPTANIFQMTAVWGNYDTTTMYAVTADSPYDTSAFAVRKWLARNGGVVSKNADAFTVVWLAVGF